MQIAQKDAMINNFRIRNIEVTFFENLQEAKQRILELIPQSASVGIGHSATLQAMGIVEALDKRGNAVFDKTKAGTKEEVKAIKKRSLLTDWYISGSNAISAEGHIVNIDHSGNRVAALTYGPDHIIIVVGVNKLTDNLAEAIERAKNTASPRNAKRAGYHPPCIELGKCIDCKSAQRVCHYLSIIQGQHEKDRMQLFIVNEELGF